MANGGAVRKEYEFTQDWFSWNIPIWETNLKLLEGGCNKVIEIGSFEGRSATWLIDNVMPADGEITCIDTWQGGAEHAVETMSGSYDRFCRNMDMATSDKPEFEYDIQRKTSVEALAELINLEVDDIDFIYIDGSHSGPDVLTDACMAFPLLRSGGFLAFDDYLWGNGADLIERPKYAVDAFVNLFAKKIKIISIGHQFWVQKI